MTTFSTYKPSNKANPVGLIVLFAVMLFGGFAIYWVYEFIESWMPLIYLSILIALGAGFAIGALGNIVIKKFKIRSPMLAIIVSCIAILLATIGRWAVYCSRDFDKQFREPLEERKIDEASLGLNKVDPSSMSPERYDQFVKMMSLILDSFEVNGSDNNNYTDAIIDRTKMISGMKELFGTSYSEFLTNLKNCTDAYQLYVKYLGLEEVTTMDMITHPGRMFKYIKMVNDQGRWNIKSHRYSLSSQEDSEPVKGIFLWFVWLGELLMLTAPAIAMVYDTLKDPYIESENEWAITDKNAPNFLFEDPNAGKGNSVAMLKSEIMKNPENLFMLKPIGVISRIPEVYFKVTYKRSNFFDENYITIIHSTLVNARKNERKNITVIKDMRVDASYIATLYGLFEQTVPVMCHGENRAKEFEAKIDAKEQAIANGLPLSPQRPKATGAEAIFDQPSMYVQARQHNTAAAPSSMQPSSTGTPSYMQPSSTGTPSYMQSPTMEAPSYMQPSAAPVQEETSFAQQELANEKKSANNHGDMDGLDTSNLDLDNFDFSKMN